MKTVIHNKIMTEKEDSVEVEKERENIGKLMKEDAERRSFRWGLWLETKNGFKMSSPDGRGVPLLYTSSSSHKRCQD